MRKRVEEVARSECGRYTMLSTTYRSARKRDAVLDRIAVGFLCTIVGALVLAIGVSGTVAAFEDEWWVLVTIVATVAFWSAVWWAIGRIVR